jgi:hypothetical protein
MNKKLLVSLFALALPLCALAQKGASGTITHAEPPQRAYTAADLKTTPKTLWQNLTDNIFQLPFGADLEIEGYIVDKGISIYATANLSLSDEQKGKSYVICVLPGRGDIFNLGDFETGEKIKLTGKFYALRSYVVVKQCKRVTEE